MTEQSLCALEPWEIYVADSRPQSAAGELLCNMLFVQVCLSDGWGPEQIRTAYSSQNDETDAVKRSIQNCIKLFAKPLQDGRFKTFARAFGGGPTLSIPPHHWELDDPTHRYARSAYAFDSPFDANAEYTHWIFADAEVEQQILDLHRSYLPQDLLKSSLGNEAQQDERTVGNEDFHFDSSRPQDLTQKSFIRLEAVEKLVGLKKSEIYKRIKSGRFPQNESIGGGRAKGWRLSLIEDWLDNPL